MSSGAWYENYFGADYLRIYAPLLTSERTAREVEGIVSLFSRHGVPPGATVLDLACGHGRITIPLAQRGFRLIGQDLSDFFLSRAKAQALADGVDVRWVRGDMREVSLDGEADAVISIFTAFGYFESEEEDCEVLRQVHKALKPGGILLMESMHRDALVRGFQPSAITRHEDGLITLEERHFDPVTGRSDVRNTIIEPDGRRAEYAHSVRVYNATDLVRLSRSAGLVHEACYGGLDGSELSVTRAGRLVVVCRKPNP